MDFGQLIGKIWRLRAEPALAATARPATARAERSDLSHTAHKSKPREPVDEQAGDSFLGYVDEADIAATVSRIKCPAML